MESRKIDPDLVKKPAIKHQPFSIETDKGETE